MTPRSLEQRTTDFWAPLHIACSKGNLAAAAALLAAGADSNAVAEVCGDRCRYFLS
jgi:ankyrin repeat protein